MQIAIKYENESGEHVVDSLSKCANDKGALFMKDRNTPIYLIYVCEELIFISGLTPAPKEPVKAKRLMRPGKDQPMGFCYDREEAIYYVRYNANDMFEGCFTYALVEEVYPGYNLLEAKQRWAFKIDLNTSKYVEIQIPEYVTDDVVLESLWKKRG